MSENTQTHFFGANVTEAWALRTWRFCAELMYGFL